MVGTVKELVGEPEQCVAMEYIGAQRMNMGANSLNTKSWGRQHLLGGWAYEKSLGTFA